MLVVLVAAPELRGRAKDFTRFVNGCKDLLVPNVEQPNLYQPFPNGGRRCVLLDPGFGLVGEKGKTPDCTGPRFEDPPGAHGWV